MTEGWSRGPVIGHGSSATVWLARSPPNGDPFACKSAEFVISADLQREQRFLSVLNSSDIISYLGCDITTEGNSRPYYNLFMEYAPGGSLSDYIKKQGGKLDEPAIRSRTSEILSGLAYLHSQGIVHCDIKGQNILVGADGRAKIADFGCARWEIEDTQIRGTPMFMAPEVARGQEQGPAADVWALGCTVLEMATGSLPWPEVSDPITALHRIAFSSDVPEIPSWISQEGKNFLDKCLRRDAGERWTVDQLVQHTFSAVKLSSNEDRTTPKSILDQDTWDALSEDDDEMQEEVLEDSIAGVSERMHQLFTGEPNWTWDESWVTVRSEDIEHGIVASPVQLDVGIKNEDIALIAPALVRTNGSTIILGTNCGEDLEHLFIEFEDYESNDSYFDDGNERESRLFGYNFSGNCNRFTDEIDASRGLKACNLFIHISLEYFWLDFCFFVVPRLQCFRLICVPKPGRLRGAKIRNPKLLLCKMELFVSVTTNSAIPLV